MWKLIDKSSVIDGISTGQIIAPSPSEEDRYEVKSIHLNGYITALHSNGKTEIKFFPEKDLIDGKWWIKDESAK
jgi:hypothetical protein